MAHTFYQVAPKYTAGSPAQVDEQTARRVAAEEARSYANHLEGVYGPEDQEKAQAEGLGGISERVTQHAGHMVVEDLITGQRFRRLYQVSTARCDFCGTEQRAFKTQRAKNRRGVEVHDLRDGRPCPGGLVARQEEIQL